MFGAIPYKTKQFYLVLIKISIVVGAFYFIYHKLSSNESLSFLNFVDYLKENRRFSLKTVSFLVFLSIFNWFFEILKWQVLASHIKKISFTQSLEQSLGSLTASLFTPNRVGEYGAKIMYFQSKFRKKIAFLNLLGNVFQMTITVTLGLIGLIFFIKKYDLDINYLKVARFSGIILLFIFFGYLSTKQNVIKVRGFSLKKVLEFIKILPTQIYFKGLLLALIRYLAFSFQFYWLLHVFGVDVSYFNAMVVITSMYLLASVIPSIFIFDVIIKGSVAVYLFDIVGVNELTTLSIVTIMWLLNFVLPSIIGSGFVIKFKLPETK
ncbi:lysylphosphatidylglycerol synthase domain-containing protein [Hanstruepera marina]|uniref:lysylphosphatidylglycerol synthase domain-containing protein n=1 Tax=Hanstruepera marina TaxID=2873265 RepID=UPI001CA7A631|nr:lysylphosphatidylglycerol synthase domain-containing protein [Hanstruepera marina]